MHISSLPSKYGIGTLGIEAYKFVDFLYESGQTYWQVLPIGQTSYGDSPYQTFSCYAGNPYFIDLDMLVQDGLLTNEEVKPLDIDVNNVDVRYNLALAYEHKNDKEAAIREYKYILDINPFSD